MTSRNQPEGSRRPPRGARSRTNPLHIAQHRGGAGHVVEAQEGGERLVIDVAPQLWQRGKNLHLGPERDAAGVLRIEERLFAEPIPRDEQLPPRPIGQGEGEHPAQVARQLGMPLPVAVEKDLRIRPGAEAQPRAVS